MSRVSLSVVSPELEGLTDEERRALRASRFHSDPIPLPPDRRCRLAHPGGPLATNKAAALAKFLKRKLEEPGGAASLNPSLVERAVQNAKITTRSVTLPKVRHVDSFSDSEEVPQEDNGKTIHSSSEIGTSSSKKKHKKSKAQINVKFASTKGVKAKGNKKKKKI